MADNKKITEFPRSTPSGGFELVAATGSYNYKVSYTDFAEHSALGTKSGTFSELLTISGVAASTGASSAPTPADSEYVWQWSGVPASIGSPGSSGDIAFDEDYFYICTSVARVPTFALTDISSSADTSLFLTASGDAYGCGKNSNGELGLGNITQKLYPTYITGDTLGSEVTGVSSSKDNSLFLAAVGDAYGCGKNYFGELGLGNTTQTEVPTFITGQLDGGTPVTDIFASISNSFFLTAAGDVYGCGHNDLGQLGLGNITQTEVPTYITGLSEGSAVTGVSSADNSLFLTAAGDVYGCGINLYGELGLGNTTQKFSPTYITGSAQGSAVTSVWCAERDSFFLTAAGDVYGCGQNRYGVLGLDNSVQKFSPTYVTGLAQGSAVTGIWSYDKNSFFLTTAGAVYGVGRNEFGELGLNDTVQRWPITLLTGSVAAISAGLENTLFLTTAGDTYGCGRNLNGELGLGSQTMTLAPTLISGAGYPSAGGPWRRASLSSF